MVETVYSNKNFEAASSIRKSNSPRFLREKGSIKESEKSNMKPLTYQNQFFQSEKQQTNTTIGETKSEKRYRRQRLCFCWTPYCFGCIALLILLLSGLAALFIALLANKTSNTTTVTTITTTTITTTTTTATTATTTTATTATTTTATTATTTTVTTATTTTATTVTSTTSTTTTTENPCVLVSMGTSNILYTVTSPNTTSYYCLAFAWTSSITGLVNLAFELRQDPDYWYLDDVSVDNGTSEMLINGNFESGALSPWVRMTPNGPCSGAPGTICNWRAHSGTYDLCDGSNGCADLISQSFMATIGQAYNITFWMKSGSPGSVISANVTLT
ncbi:unnamed protein product [Rotaria sp. Silwood1]|nr:unnamed protein product [Rotaria sp. Silwood1]